jgi:SAM-dependent methyltransferase
MSKPGGPVPTSAASEGPEWSARATAWAELWGGLAAPAFEAVADATGVRPGTRVLDVGCGSGEFCRLAVARAAAVSGIDAAEGMIEIARGLVPAADLRVGAMERLPWDEDSFDVVTGFNAFQFAADMVVALREAKRVVRPGGQVAICNWSRPQDRELSAVFGPLRELEPPPEPGPPQPDPPAVGEPGVLEDLAREAGLDPGHAVEVDVPYATPDYATLERALLAGAGLLTAIEHSGEDAVRKAITGAAAPFRQPDGSYRFQNKFRYLVAHA